MTTTQSVFSTRYPWLSRGVWLVLASQAFLTLSHTLAKLATQTTSTPIIMLMRYALPVGIVTGWVMMRHRSLQPIRGFIRSFSWLLCLRGVLGVASMVCLVMGFRIGAISRIAFLNATSALWALLLAMWWLSERPSRWLVGALGVGFLGMGLIFHPTSSGVSWADGLALASAITTAMVAISLKRLRQTHGSGSIVMGFYVVGLLVMLPLAITQQWPTDWVTWGYLVGLSVAGGVGQWCLSEAYHYLPASGVSGLGMSGVLFFLVSGMMVFGERLQPIEWVGGMLVLGAVLVLSVRR